MANPGVGTKFVSVNLNKSYGQQPGQGQYHHHHHHHHNGGSGFLGINSGGRDRGTGSSGGYGSGSGGSGGMVVLSRPRSSQKAGPKLSVPPPMNLPSLRKEHEKFDVLGSGSGVGASGISGGGMRPGSSGVGWTKPASGVGHHNNNKVVPGTGDNVAVDGNSVHGAVSRADLGVNSGMVYMPPSARLNGGLAAPGYIPVVEKAAVLRGEDFPSLRAAVPVATNALQKPKDSLSKKQEQTVSEEVGNNEGKLTMSSSALVDKRPQGHSSRNGFANSDNSQVSDQKKKRDEYFSGPLPIVRLNARSDWADDERDTGLGLVDRGRDPVSKNDAYWDGDFDMPRASYLPPKPASNNLDWWGQRDGDAAKSSTSEVHKPDTYNHERNGRTASREGKDGNSWRSSSLSAKQGFNYQDLGGDRNGPMGRSFLSGTEVKRDAKYATSAFQAGAMDDFGRRELANGSGQQPWNRSADSLGSRATERNYRDRNVSGHARYNGNVMKSYPVQNSSFGSRGLHWNDPVLDITRNAERRNFTKSEKSYTDDSFPKDFDHLPDPGSLVGVVKRKKDAMKLEDVYDPVRESFEAELERVQKLQEQERQRMIEEQERVFELACREEEEKSRRAREQEELQRRLEEEAKEAELRAEQERQDSLQRAEEQRIAREEEKQRILMEEERRKQAAKQKLLELEEKIARRQANVAPAGSTSSGNDDKAVGLLNEKEDIRVSEVSDWEDSERMVERLTSASSDSSSQNRPFDNAGNATLKERGKLSNSWRRDPFSAVSSSNFGISEQDNGYFGTRPDPALGDRILPRKEFYASSGYASSRSYPKGGFPDDQMEQPRLQRWNIGNEKHFNQNAEIDAEYHGNFAERRGGDVDWGQGQSLANLYSSSSEQILQVAETDGSYSLGRSSRYSMRQPRVLPPPTLSSMHKNVYRGEVERPGPSAAQGNEMHFVSTSGMEVTVNTNFDNSHQEHVERSSNDIEPDITVDLSGNQGATIRCDSQSSLSVSSAPDSPVHLSHDDPDESGGYMEKLPDGDTDMVLSGNGTVLMPVSDGQENVDVFCSEYNGDEGEWSMENDDLVQEQDEYDEDEACYQEEVRDGDEETMDSNQEFDDIRVENTSSRGNLVMGLYEGVEFPMPNDELERSSETELVDYAVPLSSISNVETHLVLVTEKAMEQLVIDADNNAGEPTASKTMDNSEVSGESISGSSSSHSSGDPILPTAPTVPARTEIPVNLKFGLFSGRPLIPSPVPAIQIGSIQMPLHLHPQVVPSTGSMQQSQTPIFQFGQLRYSSPVSPGVISLASHSMSFLHSNSPVNFSFNQNQDGRSTVQEGYVSTQNSATVNAGSQAVENPTGLLPRDSILHEDNMIKKSGAAPAAGERSHKVKQESGVERSLATVSNMLPSQLVQEQGRQTKASRNDRPSVASRKQEGQALSGVPSTNRKEKYVTGSRFNGPLSGGRVKHYIFKVKNASFQPSHPETDPSDLDSSGDNRRPRRPVKRTEFRVRETGEVRRSGVVGSTTNIDDRTYETDERTIKSWSGKAIIANKLSKEVTESDRMSSVGALAHKSDSTGGNLMKSSKEPSGKGHMPHQPLLLEHQSRSNSQEEDIDANLESGVVCIFEQPGIEVPSDEDDFIEVRSKRQMLHDKREQREKEIKAKSQITKVPRKRRTLQSTHLLSGSKRNTSFGSGEALKSVNTNITAKDGQGVTPAELPTVLSKTSVAQSLPPIGTPTVKNDAQADLLSQKIKSARMGSHALTSENSQSDIMFGDSNKVNNNVESPGSWRNSGINQTARVMQLTQSQLDEAMKPAEFDPLASVGGHTISVTEPIVPSSSVLPKDKSFSSAASPINSLLAGEKIQFGAVTSPTVLPSTRHSVSHGIGSPSSFSDVQMPQKRLADNDRSIFFDKERTSSESCPQLKDCEAEAEAAASAVAVAAISSDEIVGNDLSAGTVVVSDAKTFGATEIGGISKGIARDQQSAAQSRSEEPLNVSLPADLSLDTPPISSWQPLTGQTTSQVLSHFPGGPASNYPFYEMNPILGSPIFAFGPNEESGSSQPPSSAPSPGPHPRWQAAHSGLDSFYGPPTGFTGPFISPGGIHQGPPHMVVYNHFAPVGQFGQVGLSFMGTTFIPSNRQPDWKHNHAPSSTIVDGDMKNMNVGSSQRNVANMPPPVQSLAPGSPLLPMAPTMFDVSPFQSSPDMSVPARWPHIPTTQLQAASAGMPMQQQVGVPQFRNSHSIDPSMNASRFAETRTSTPEGGHNFSSAADATANGFPDELALLEPANSSSAVSIPRVSLQSSSSNAGGNAGITDLQSNDNSVSSCGTDATGLKIHPSQHKGGFPQNNVSSSCYNNQRGGTSQKVGEWAHRRGGSHGRNHSLGAEKGFSSSKVKQVYVAKQTLVAKSAAS